MSQTALFGMIGSVIVGFTAMGFSMGGFRAGWPRGVWITCLVLGFLFLTVIPLIMALSIGTSPGSTQ